MRKKSSQRFPQSPRATNTRSTFALTVLFILPLGFIACPGERARNDNLNRQGTPATATNTTVATASPAQNANIDFDGERAFAHVRKQVEAGPRPPGSVELAEVRHYIVSELKSYGLNVTQDEFRASTPEGERKMVNITAELVGEASDRVIIASHYDTKFIEDFRFVGANDGGSSTAALLELARVLAAGKKPRFTYWFVFFDGEEAFCFNWEECGKPNAPDNTYGSRRYVAQLIDKNELKRVRAMILLDMIGYKNLRIPREELSSAWLVNIIWQAARELGYEEQFANEVENVTDDHVPFLKAGVDAVDIIQLRTYQYWHTAEDTLDKISPRSLKIVGDVVLASLPRIEQHLSNKRGG